MNKAKILVIRFSSIGDIVLTSPIVRVLKSQIHAEVHYLTKSVYSTLVTNNPYIDVVHEFDAESKQLINQLKAENFDLIIDLHKSMRSVQLVKTLGCKSIFFDKITFKKYLLIYTGINLLPKLHLVDRYWNALKPIGLENDGLGLDYFIPNETSIQKFNLPNNFICLAIGATHFTKTFPTSKWIEFLTQISGNQYFVLIGGNSEKAVGSLLEHMFPLKVKSLCDLTTLNESAAIIRASQCLISNDTGMLHIGAALQTKIISLWGGTIKEYGYWPYYPNGIEKNISIEIENLNCRPCSKFGRSNCPKKHFNCMNLLKINEMQNALNILLN